MKKLVLAVVLFVFAASVPCHAVKLIKNNESSRIVPSRSGFGNVRQEADYTVQTYKKPKKYDSTYDYLGKFIRPELKGTTWYYYTNVHNVKDDNDGLIAVNNKSKNYPNYNIREAADYYYNDTVKNTVNNTPAVLGQ